MNRWPYIAILAGALGFVLSFGGCAHFSFQQYEGAFKVCLEQQGVADAENQAANIWTILSQGGVTNDIVNKIENLGISVAGQGIQLVAACAVQAWLDANPVSPNVVPTPSQVAARVYLARHLSALPHHSTLSH